MAISREFIQDIHDRLDIADVISSYVSLKPAGRRFKGLCPFHGEKTPSFTVYPETNSFYCFGCGAAGDVIGFIQRIENLDRIEAIKACADRAGLSMPEEGYDDSLTKRRLRILSANREAARFFNAQLREEKNRHALEYYLNRGLTPATITHFGLGYAPDDWHALTNHLKSMGYTENELILANLSRRSDGKAGCYDIFRNRMMFPIIDVRGNVVAFSGRRYNEQDKQKYVNTSDTPVFKKGNTIFGLNFAKNSSDSRLIIVEGQMDVIALHQAGFTNTVACLGTALTTEQANILARYAEELLICYDNDEAGRKATARALEILENTGLKLKVINMEGGKDPDEIIKTHGKERFNDLIKGAANRTEYRLNTEMSKYNVLTDDGKLKFLTAAAEVLADSSPMEAEIYTLRLSNEFGINKDSLSAQIENAKKNLKRKKASERMKEDRAMLANSFSDKSNPERAKNIRAASAEEVLIASLMRNPDFYQKLRDRFSPDDFVTQFNRRIITHLIELIEGGYSTDVGMFSEVFSSEELGSIQRISFRGDETANTLKECEDCIKVIKEEKAALSNPLAQGGEITDEQFADFFRNKQQ